MRRLYLALLLAALLTSPFVSAVGISPTKKLFDYEIGKSYEGALSIVNSEGKDMRVVLTARGELAESITISKALITVPAGGKADVTYTLKAQNGLSPGAHDSEIVVTRLPDGDEAEGASVGTALSVASLIRLTVPYPGKYAESRLVISEAGVNESINFVLPVSNKGTQDIGSAVAAIEILGPTNAKLGSARTDQKPIKAQDTEELVARWRADVNPGIYHAKATLTYDDQVVELEKNFAVGDFLVELLAVSVKDFKLGGIAKVSLLVKNSWNQDLDALYAELIVYRGEEVIYQTKSASIALPGQGSATLPVFWDTQGLVSGTYPATVILHYADKTSEHPLSLAVGANSIDARFIGPTGNILNEQAGSMKSSPISMFMVIQIVLILANVGLFFYFKRRFSKKNQP